MMVKPLRKAGTFMHYMQYSNALVATKCNYSGVLASLLTLVLRDKQKTGSEKLHSLARSEAVINLPLGSERASESSVGDDVSIEGPCRPAAAAAAAVPPATCLNNVMS